ncbi:MAG: tetratricopeptide repeat protein [Muribaculaceae bacterium]|nr:tetratricopeptide repeat protein [Muribaculaceae bacterium]
MQKQDIKDILDIDKSLFAGNDISPNVFNAFDEYIILNSEYISEESFLIYKKFAGMKQDAPESMKKNLFSTMLNYIEEKVNRTEYVDALFLFRFLAVKSQLSAASLYKIAEILSKSGNNNLAIMFVNLYEIKETNKPLLFLTLANFYNLELKDYKTAIKYYEKYLQIDETKSVIYTILASLYAKLYGDLGLKDQIYYFTKAYKLKPNDRLSLHGLAFCYDKLGDKISAKDFYEKLLENNPTETDYYNYGAFLISCGDFVNGHKYFAHRFLTEDKNLEYPAVLPLEKRWDMKSDISDKVLLVHYEQGFGDTFMYCRFVPELRKLAAKVIFIVQDELVDLIKNSSAISDGIEVISSRELTENLQYDYHMMLLDAPLALGVSDVPLAEGYLSVLDYEMKEYAQSHINDGYKLKVGIAYHGDKSSNYHGRDVDYNRFRTLLNLENVELYSLQVGAEDEEGVISLGETFDNFSDTACAIKSMDVVVSTDNVILNLAGALGVKTFGLFNKHPNFRWYKLDGTDVGWYKSVVPFQVEENNCWSDVFSKLTNELSRLSSVCLKK